MGDPPQTFQFCRSGTRLRICTYNEFPADNTDLLVQGPQLENHCSILWDACKNQQQAGKRNKPLTLKEIKCNKGGHSLFRNQELLA